MKRRILKYFVLIFGCYSCCHLPFVDCFRPHHYVTDGGDFGSYLINNDSISIKIVPEIENSIFEEGRLKFNVKHLLLITNQSTKTLDLSLSDAEFYCQDKKQKYKYKGNPGQDSKFKIMPLTTKEAQVIVNFSISDSKFKVVKYHELIISKSEASLGDEILQLNPVKFLFKEDSPIH